jgi:hypothetical protein
MLCFSVTDAAAKKVGAYTGGVRLCTKGKPYTLSKNNRQEREYLYVIKTPFLQGLYHYSVEKFFIKVTHSDMKEIKR